MSRAALLLLALAGAAAGQALDLAGIVRKADRQHARKLVKWARDAAAAGLPATARRALGMALEEDAECAEARTVLAALPADAKDADAALAQEYGRMLALLEEERVRETIRLCTKYGTPEERRPILLPLLERMPRRADLHEALGHARIGDSGVYVRPELVPMARMLPWRLQAWRNFADDPAPVERAAFRLDVPGLAGPLAFYATPGGPVASLPDLGAAPAQAVVRTRGFLRFLLGEDAALWTPPALLFLGADEYGALVRALHPDEEAFTLYSSYGNYEHRDFYAIRVWGAGNAAERYAHGAGYLTLYALAVPGQDGERDTRAHAWLLEGFGYLASLELFDQGNVSFVSLEESQRKRPWTRPAPANRTAAACRAWVREQVLAGNASPLRDVCARSLNDLDLCASLQAYTFLRFLFLYDPDGARRLPAALRAERAGPQAERVDRALKVALGKGLADLEPLWRAFLLEVDS